MKKLSALLLYIFTVVTSDAQKESLSMPAAADRNTLLWEVTGNGMTHPSWVLGTMHILCPEDAYLSTSVQRILDQVKGLYFETDLDNMALMFMAVKSMAMRNDTTLSDLLSKEEVEKVKIFFGEKIPFPFSVLERFKPMLLAGMLAEKVLPCKAGSGTEMLLMEEAEKRKLPTEGLEAPEYQFGLLDSIPYGLQASELVKAIDSGNDSQNGMVERLLSAFQQQNLDSLELLTLEEEAGISGYEHILLYNRNISWVEKFPSIAEKGSYLIAVGAGHLPGEKGVLKLLESKGYSIRPILNEKPQN